MEDWRGRTLSKVKITSLIARGGMAAVYLGEHTTLQKPMAIKILHDHLTDTPEIMARFKAEAQSVAALRHPNIVQVFDFDIVEGRPYIAMEYIRGATFSTYLNDLHQRDLQLPLETIALIIASLSSALDYAHERGIIHRDIKPANIILRQGKSPIQKGQPIPSDAEPILTDFGIARIRDATTQTATGTILGTPAYMSPEQVEGIKVDHRTDIYSLGIILYEMLAGAPPFMSDSDTPVSILMKHLDEQPAELEQVRPNVQEVVNKALAKDRKERYQWAGALAKALSNAVKPELTSILRSSNEAEQKGGLKTLKVDRMAPETQPTSGQKRKLPPMVGLGALGLVGLAVIVAFALAGGLPRETPEGNPTQVPTNVIAAQPELKATEPLPTLTVEVVPTEEPIAVAPVVLGEVTVLDDHLQASLGGLSDPPEGMVYRGWLVGQTADGELTTLDLNSDSSLSFTNGRVTADYALPDGSNLLAQYHSFLLTLNESGQVVDFPSDPIYQAGIDLDFYNRARLFNQVKDGEPISLSLLDWLSRQARHASDHAGFALGSVGGNDLPGAKQHSEHVINIIEGREGDLFSDWDGNGIAENPGDPVGLLNYLYLLRSFAQYSIDAGVDHDGLEVTVRGQIDFLIDKVTDIRESARQIVLADTIELVIELGMEQELETATGLRDQINTLAELAQGLDFSLHLPATE